MKKTVDLFSTQARTYKKYRPLYPKEFYDGILSLVKTRSCSWDCGTGNGQVAQYMADHFEKVFATDISENQLQEAVKRKNIVYKKERAEITSFKNNQFDLITVAQAAHWFDFKPFYKEVERTGKNNGIIAVWGYDLMKMGVPYDEIISHFYHKIVGPYWNEQRKHVDMRYETIKFPFKEIKLSRQYQIVRFMNLPQLEGYFNSWSSVQKYIQSQKKNPVEELVKELSDYWKDPKEVKRIDYPIFTKIGLIKK